MLCSARFRVYGARLAAAVPNAEYIARRRACAGDLGPRGLLRLLAASESAKLLKGRWAEVVSEAPAESGGVAVICWLGKTMSMGWPGDNGLALSGVSGSVLAKVGCSAQCWYCCGLRVAASVRSLRGCILIAVKGVDCVGVDRSMAVTYTLESVLKVVGDFGSACASADFLVLTCEPGIGLVWRDSFGLLGASGPAISSLVFTVDGY